MRDLKADRELCNKATPGPWLLESGDYPFHIVYFAYADAMAAYCARDDVEFIIQAREGWPHAIERAMEAEELNRELVEAAGALVDDLEWSDKVYASWPPYVQRVEVLLAKAKEVLGNDRQGDYRTP
jgi:hypothetical protein